MTEIRRRYRGERYRRTRRDEIVRRALKVFARKGYDTTSMDDIADRARVAKGTLYYYFPSKEDLYQAVMVHSLEGIFEELSESIRDITDPFEAFTRLLEALVTLFNGKPDLLTLFLPLLNGQELPGQRRVEELVGEVWNLHRGLLERHFGSLIAGDPSRAHAVRFMARGLVTNLLIQLRKGATDHIAHVVPGIAAILRDGFGQPAPGATGAMPPAHPTGISRAAYPHVESKPEVKKAASRKPAAKKPAAKKPAAKKPAAKKPAAT